MVCSGRGCRGWYLRRLGAAPAFGSAALRRRRSRLRDRGHPGLCRGWQAMGRLVGGRPGDGRAFGRSRAQLRGGRGDQSESGQNRQRPRCPREDCHRRRRPDPRRVCGFPGRALQRPGLCQPLERRRQQLCRAAADHRRCDESALRDIGGRPERRPASRLDRQAQRGGSAERGKELSGRRACLCLGQEWRCKRRDGADRARPDVRMLSARCRFCRPAPAGGRVSQHLRRHHARPCRHDLRRCDHSGAGAADQR